MSFHARRPRAPLDTCVDVLWSVASARTPHRLERVLPTGTAQLVLNLAADRINTYDGHAGVPTGSEPGSILSGPRSTVAVIDGDAQYDVVGACIVPGGLPMLAPAAAYEMAEADIPLDALWSDAIVSRLRDRLHAATTAAARLDVLEAGLIEQMRPRRLHPAVASALDAFARHPSAARVDRVVRESGFSARYLIDRFKAQVGLTPKRYCRVQRFQLAVARAHRGHAEEWADLALDCGFCDQAHLINEFRDFSGVPPSVYLDNRTAHQNHVTFVQSPESSSGHHGRHD